MLVLPVTLPGGASADAHPLGNFTINHYDGLRLFPDHIELHAVVDTAEIPTLQDKPATDTDGDGTISPGEADQHGRSECAALAVAVTATVNSRPVRWQIAHTAATYPPGQPPLATTRLTCTLFASANLRTPATVEFTDSFRADRIGWREITAIGESLRVVSSTAAGASISDELRRYPNDLLSNPRDERSATVHVAPGTGPVTGVVAPLTTRISWLDHALASATNTFNDLAGGTRLTPLVGTAAALLALLLGASHAALPGHGKTVMAAYLAGRRGTRRDAALVGATVTLTHTAGVLILGLLITALSPFAPEAALRWLGILSGLLVALVGAGLLRSALRHQEETPTHAISDPAPVLAGTRLRHGHTHGHTHTHGYTHGHGHGWDGQQRPFGRAGLVGMGIAGGLVPSPTALLVLLGAIGLGRSWFGIALVLCYGLGMATTLTLAGLLLVTLRDRITRSTIPEQWRDRGARISSALPALTAVLVLVVGLGLALRSLLGPG
ncbi:MAG: High-affinity nickel-transporter [Pseudonocardiaceae bacterium]